MHQFPLDKTLNENTDDVLSYAQVVQNNHADHLALSHFFDKTQSVDDFAHLLDVQLPK